MVASFCVPFQGTNIAGGLCSNLNCQLKQGRDLCGVMLASYRPRRAHGSWAVDLSLVPQGLGGFMIQRMGHRFRWRSLLCFGRSPNPKLIFRLRHADLLQWLASCSLRHVILLNRNRHGVLGVTHQIESYDALLMNLSSFVSSSLWRACL